MGDIRKFGNTEVEVIVNDNLNELQAQINHATSDDNFIDDNEMSKILSREKHPNGGAVSLGSALSHNEFTELVNLHRDIIQKTTQASPGALKQLKDFIDHVNTGEEPFLEDKLEDMFGDGVLINDQLELQREADTLWTLGAAIVGTAAGGPIGTVVCGGIMELYNQVKSAVSTPKITISETN